MSSDFADLAPLMQVPSSPTRAWSGVLQAEWTDRGLSEAVEGAIRSWPMVLAVFAVFGLLDALGGRPGGPLAGIEMFGLFSGLYFAWLAGQLIRRRASRRITLELDGDEARVTSVLASGTAVVALQRSEAGVLTRWSLARIPDWTDRLQLGDRSGRCRVEFLHRLVFVSRLPSGMSAPLGLDLTRAPLDVLIGSWWPDPAARRSVFRRPGISLRGTEVGPWGRPDLADYPAGVARAYARGRSLAVLAGLLGIAALLGIIVSGPAQLDGSWLFGILGIVAPLSVAYGVSVAWRRLQRLR